MRGLPLFKENGLENIVVEKTAASSASLQHHVGNKIHFISLGCPRNLVDTEVMLGLLLRAGYEVAPDMPEADYIVVNTCGFLEASRKESTDTVRDVLAQRKTTAKLIVTGCMAQTHSAEFKQSFPQIDYILGSGDVEGILQAVEAVEPGQLVSSARSYLEVGEVPRRLSTPKHYAYLKIAEGCRKRCAYCIIPTIKGPLKSKSQEQIVREFKLMLSQGVKEVILIAQDLGDYARDLGQRGTEGLISLLRSLLTVEGDFWLRLLYLYPDEINDELIALMQSDKRICPYLDMPIQHVNDTILHAMRRKTSKEEITAIITKLRKALPDVAIRTSLIVGFPGETEEQFEELVEFIKQHPLDNIGVFRFSREPGSAAYDLPDQVPEEIKQTRYERLMQVQQHIVKKRLKKFIGKQLPVIVEGYHPESKLLMLGRHRGQCPDIDGQILIADGRKVKNFGERYLVEVIDVSDYDLVGRVVEKKK